MAAENELPVRIECQPVRAGLMVFAHIEAGIAAIRAKGGCVAWSSRSSSSLLPSHTCAWVAQLDRFLQREGTARCCALRIAERLARRSRTRTERDDGRSRVGKAHQRLFGLIDVVGPVAARISHSLVQRPRFRQMLSLILP